MSNQPPLPQNAPATIPAPGGPRHVASLDGLRAVAVIGVLLVHAGAPGFEMGWIGVDIFFVLSGFLITTLLLREFDRNGSISLWRFWCRRALRLVPAYWLYITFITALMVAGIGSLGNEGGWTRTTYIISLWGYFVNYTPLGGVWEYQALTRHLWSLAVEEQFYLIWPALFWIAIPINRRVPTWIAWALVVGILLFRGWQPQARMDSLLYTRGIGIVIGCAFALSCDAAPVRRFIQMRFLRPLAIMIVIITLVALTGPYLHQRINLDWVYRYVVPELDLVIGIIIATLWWGSPSGIARWLAWRPIVYVGQISYGLYLYHMVPHELVWGPLLGGVEHWAKWPKFGLRVTVYLALSFLIAATSYHLLEKPFLRLKDRFR